MQVNIQTGVTGLLGLARLAVGGSGRGDPADKWTVRAGEAECRAANRTDAILLADQLMWATDMRFEYTTVVDDGFQVVHIVRATAHHTEFHGEESA